MDVRVKQEIIETLSAQRRKLNGVVPEKFASVIELSSSSSDSDSSDDSDDPDENDNANGAVAGGEGPEGRSSKKRKVNGVVFVLPLAFLAPLPPDDPAPVPSASDTAVSEVPTMVRPLEKAASRSLNSSVICKQFWKAGDYDGAPSTDWGLSSGGMDHVRVHPKFLHSNAMSHKWALRAFAELLDNSLDEVCDGATYVNIDMLKSKKDGNRMLLIEETCHLFLHFNEFNHEVEGKEHYTEDGL